MDKKGKEEYQRRMMVAQIRVAGTHIRKEELKRQKMNAQANIEYAQTLQKRINDDLQLVSEPIQKSVQKASNNFRKVKPLEEIIDSGIIELIISGVPAIVSRPPLMIRRDMQEVNTFVEDVINKIIEDLSKEGMYMPKLNPVNIETFLPLSLAETKDLIDKSVGILRGIIDAAE